MNKVKQLREKLNLTQSELAEKAEVSLRTIQRIESGAPLKGFTLKAIASALVVEPQQLLDIAENHDVEDAKKINFSALAGLIIPFGNIIFPMLLLSKTKDLKNRALGKSLLSVQIVLSILLSLLMIACPFVQKFLHIKSPLFLLALLGMLILKTIVIILNGISLNKKQDLHYRLKFNFL